VRGGATTGPARWVAVVVILLTTLLGSCFEHKPTIVLEYAELVDAATPGALAVSNFDGSPGTTHVLAPTRFRIATASLTDKWIKPMLISYQLIPEDAIRFHGWTKERVGRSVAQMLDRRVVVVGKIETPLPGGGSIEIRTPDPDRGDLQEMCGRLESKE